MSHQKLPCSTATCLLCLLSVRPWPYFADLLVSYSGFLRGQDSDRDEDIMPMLCLHRRSLFRLIKVMVSKMFLQIVTVVTWPFSYFLPMFCNYVTQLPKLLMDTTLQRSIHLFLTIAFLLSAEFDVNCPLNSLLDMGESNNLQSPNFWRLNNWQDLWLRTKLFPEQCSQNILHIFM